MVCKRAAAALWSALLAHAAKAGAPRARRLARGEAALDGHDVQAEDEGEQEEGPAELCLALPAEEHQREQPEQEHSGGSTQPGLGGTPFSERHRRRRGPPAALRKLRKRGSRADPLLSLARTALQRVHHRFRDAA